jgi:uncharacterized protein
MTENDQSPGRKSGNAQPAGGGSSTDTRNWCIAAHLSGLIGLFVGPLVVWLVKKNESPEIGSHAREALNFQLTMTIAYLAVHFAYANFSHPALSGGLFQLSIQVFRLIIEIFDGVFCMFVLVCIVRATSDASDGRLWQYPLSLRLIQ